MIFKARGIINSAQFIALLLATLIISSCSPSHPTGVIVTNIIDGDTIRVIYKGKNESVRLLGIDSPEMMVNPKAERDAKRSGKDLRTIIAMGKKAAKFTGSLVKRGDTVKLEFDIGKRDKYGRLLAYVWLHDGRMLNEVIVSEGYGKAYSIPPNVKYKDMLRKAQRQAKKMRKGLWK